MPTDRIPFDAGQMSGFDELAGASPVLLNLLVEGPPSMQDRTLRTRPGIAAWSDSPTNVPSTDPVVAMVPFQDSIVYATDDGAGTRKLFAWRPGPTIVQMSLAGGDTLIAGTERVRLVAGRNVCIATGGLAPQKVTAGFTSARLGGSPPISRDVAMLAQVIVLVKADASGLFYWSYPGDTGIETWDTTLEFREAEARPDALVGCKETARQLWAFGAETTQVYVPDEQEVFAPSSTLEIGCLSSRSIIRRDQTMAWLETQARLVVSDGQGYEVLSDRGIAATVEQMATLDDCWGFRQKIGNHDLLFWVFPTEGRAFCWDTVSQVWSEARSWQDSRWQAWAPTSYLYWPARKLHLVGMPDGTIAQLSLTAYSDLTDPLRWLARTGFRTMPARRHTVAARFPMRRGEAASEDSAVDIAWRDDLGPFVPPIAATIGDVGETDPVAEVSPAGAPYQRRQWEISGSAADAFRLASPIDVYEEAEF